MHWVSVRRCFWLAGVQPEGSLMTQIGSDRLCDPNVITE